MLVAGIARRGGGPARLRRGRHRRLRARFSSSGGQAAGRQRDAGWPSPWPSRRRPPSRRPGSSPASTMSRRTSGRGAPAPCERRGPHQGRHLLAERPAEHGRFLEAFTGAPLVCAGERNVAITTPRGAIEVDDAGLLSGRAAASSRAIDLDEGPRLAAFKIACPRVAASLALLESAGMPFIAAGAILPSPPPTIMVRHSLRRLDERRRSGRVRRMNEVRPCHPTQSSRSAISASATHCR